MSLMVSRVAPRSRRNVRVTTACVGAASARNAIVRLTIILRIGTRRRHQCNIEGLQVFN